MSPRFTGLAALAVALVGGGPTVGAAPPSTLAGTQCRTGETIVYACPIKGKVVSVCARKGAISYRYGPAGRPELEITSNGHDGLLHESTGVGGGGGGFRNLRFSKGGYEYIVFHGEPGQYHETTVPWSGVAVVHGDADIANLTCPLHGPRQSFRSTDLSEFVGDIAEDTDERYSAWF